MYNIAINSFASAYSAECPRFCVIAEHLLEHGAEINQRMDGSAAPLHSAVISDSLEIVRLVLSKGADPNARNDRGQTPLHLAVQGDFWSQGNTVNVAIAELLLGAGASVVLQDAMGKTPLDHAVMKKHQPLIELLRARVRAE